MRDVSTVSTRAPSRRIDTRSEICSTSSSLWLTKITAEPRRATSRMAAKIFWTEGPGRKAVGSSRDEDFAALVIHVLDRAGEADQRSLRRRNVFHRRVGIDVEADGLETDLCASPLLAPVEAAERGRPVSADAEVFEDRHRSHDADILMQESKPESVGFARLDWQRNAFAAHQDLAGIGRVISGDDLDEGRFSRAVLTDERMDLTAPHGEVHRGKHANAREALGQALELKERGAFRLADIADYALGYFKPQSCLY